VTRATAWRVSSLPLSSLAVFRFLLRRQCATGPWRGRAPDNAQGPLLTRASPVPHPSSEGKHARRGDGVVRCKEAMTVPHAAAIQESRPRGSIRGARLAGSADFTSPLREDAPPDAVLYRRPADPPERL
jgi:hypothetical protein